MTHQGGGRPDLAVVVPCHNEQLNVLPLVQAIDACDLGEVHLVFVDDGSDDGTWAALVGLSSVRCRVTCVRLCPSGVGKERAMRRGLEHALEVDPALVAVMDADLQDPPSLLPEMCSRVLSGECSQVVAVRNHRHGESLLRRGGARLYYHIIIGSVGDGWPGIRDMRVMRPEVVRAFLEEPSGASCIKFDTLRVFGDAECARYEWTPRASGRSGWNMAKLARLACEGIVVSSSWLEFLPVVMGIVAFVVGVVLVACGIAFGMEALLIGGVVLLASLPLHVGIAVCALMLHVVIVSVREVGAHEVEVVRS